MSQNNPDWIYKHIQKTKTTKRTFEIDVSNEIGENSMTLRKPPSGVKECKDGVCPINADSIKFDAPVPFDSENLNEDSTEPDEDMEPIYDCSISNYQRLEMFSNKSKSDQNSILDALVDMYSVAPTTLWAEFFYDLVMKTDLYYNKKSQLTRLVIYEDPENGIKMLTGLLEKKDVYEKYDIQDLLYILYSFRESYKIPITYITYYYENSNSVSLSNKYKFLIKLERFFTTEEIRDIVCMLLVGCEESQYENPPETKPFKLDDVNYRAYILLTGYWIILRMETHANVQELKSVSEESAHELESESAHELESAPDEYAIYDEVFYNRLLEFATDPELDYNIRADAADCLLNVPEFRSDAKKILEDLGGSGNFYENGQNVHLLNFDAIVDAVQSIEYTDDVPYRIVVDDIAREIENDDDFEAFDSAIERIENDRVLYTKYKWSTKLGLLKVYNYVVKTATDVDNKKEMMKRLAQEIVESHKTCSSGHFRRVLNALTGFNGLSPSMSWVYQIRGNFKSKLNEYIQNYSDREVALEALTEMATFNKGETVRTNYNKILQEAIPAIAAELRADFVESGLIPIDKFEEYYRDAVQSYHYTE